MSFNEDQAPPLFLVYDFLTSRKTEEKRQVTVNNVSITASN